MQKVLEKQKGKFLIGYCDNSEDITLFKSGYLSETLRITFYPNTIMSEEECSIYTSEMKTEVIEEAKKIAADNFEFYKNFDLSFYREFSGYCLGYNLNRQLIVINSSLNIKSTYKTSEILC